MNLDGERGEGRWKFLFFSIISVMQWFEGDIKITIMSPFIFQHNYENDEKIWLLKLLLQK